MAVTSPVPALTRDTPTFRVTNQIVGKVQSSSDARAVIAVAINDARLGYVYRHCMLKRLADAVGWARATGNRVYSDSTSTSDEGAAFWSHPYWAGVAKVEAREGISRTLHLVTIDLDELLELHYERSYQHPDMNPYAAPLG